MKLLYFSQDYTVHDYRFLEKLAETGHDVWYLRFETNPVPMETRPIPTAIKVVDWMGNRTYRLQGRDRFKLFLKFRNLLRQLKPDLVHAGPVQTCGFFTALAGFRPMLLMSWGSDILTHADTSIIERWKTKFTIRRADMIACDCLAVRDKILKLARYPADRIIIFPWGVELGKFHPAPSSLRLREKLGWKDSNYIVMNTRSLEPIYGVEVFLEAVRDVVKKAPETRILMLGNGSLEPRVKDFIAQENLGGVVKLTGRVPHDMLPDYFNEADLFVSTSYSDGSSVSLLEAMACQLPVVVTDLPSNREWLTPGTNGWLVRYGDIDALSSAILEAMKNRSKAKGMGKTNAAVVRQKADWDKNFNILLEAYQELV